MDGFAGSWEMVSGDRKCGRGGRILLHDSHIAPMDRSSASFPARGIDTHPKEGAEEEAEGREMAGWGGLDVGNAWKNGISSSG